MVKEKPCVGRCKEERERGSMWLRLNRVQTADLKSAEFSDPNVTSEVRQAVAKGRHYNDATLVLFTSPKVARAILRWSEVEGVRDDAHRRGARAMRERMFPEQKQPTTDELAILLGKP
jgi:hypothetical protein